MTEKLAKVLKNASITARRNFKFFWREQFWDLRKSKDKCQFISVCCSVSDEVDGEKVSEQFWLSNVMCDGMYVYGSINRVPKVAIHLTVGDVCTVPIMRVEDWIYVKDENVYGAFTLHAQRNFMSEEERNQFDKQWGFNFGNPLYPERFPKYQSASTETELTTNTTKIFGLTITGKKKPNDAKDETHPYANIDWELDHPDALSRTVKYDKIFRSAPEKVNTLDANGWSPLHNHVMAGNRYIVQLLLELGADKSIRTQHGHTARDLAKIMGWQEIIPSL